MKRRSNVIKTYAVILCGMAIIGLGHTARTIPPSDDNTIIVSAEENQKEFKFEKIAVDKDTTIDTAYLWPDEKNVSFTGIYRDGKLMADDKMVTVTPGSVYHFRGKSDNATLYTQVYVGSISEIDVTEGETGTWYALLPSVIRERFENEGWTWETGWEYTGRAYLDTEHTRVMVKDNDHTAVLYGIGLYLDNDHDYSTDRVFAEEREAFKETFGQTENLFASAVEYYYSRGGELNNKCPQIYAFVSDIMAGLEVEVTPPESENTQEPEEQETAPEENNEQEQPAETEEIKPVLMKDLLEYVNNMRLQSGLPSVAWDNANNDAVVMRAKEISELMSQTRPDGSDAFTAYTDDVMCEIRLRDAYTAEDVYGCAESSFLREDAKSFSCAIYGDVGILTFIW